MLDLASQEDACGNGILDPDTLDGKLDDIDLETLDPVPGNVVAKADLCEVWVATELIPEPDGDLHLILYGAWERSSANGNATAYWALRGSEPGAADDYLVQFGGDGLVVLGWDGSSWVPVLEPGPDQVDLAYDEPGAALFAEFAIDLTAVGLPGLETCRAYTSVGVISQTSTGNSSALADFATLGDFGVSLCGSLIVEKETSPAVPAPAAGFGFTVQRSSGSDVSPGQPTIEGQLVVPGAATATIDRVLAGTDYLIAETSMPEGWTLESLQCVLTDLGAGGRQWRELAGGVGFTVLPGHTTVCRIVNLGPPTLTVVKVADPADGTEFSFEVSTSPGGATSELHLESGQSASVPVDVGDEVTVTELPADEWVVERIACLGDDDAATTDDGVTLQVDQGEQIVCVFINRGGPVDASATLVVAKSADGDLGGSFDFAVDGPGAAPTGFSLTPDDVAAQVVVVEPAQGGSDYTVSEGAQEGWRLDSLECVGPAPAEVDLAGGAATVALSPGEAAVCAFRNEQVVRTATLTVTKHTLPAGGGGFEFRVPGADPRRFALDDGDTQVLAGLHAGTYVVSESTGLGWDAVVRCNDGTEVAQGRVTIELVPGDDVECEFTNTARASVTLTKTAEPVDAQDFGFVVTTPDGGAGEITLDDDGDETDAVAEGLYPSVIVAPALAPGTWSIGEQAADGWVLTSLDCAGATGTAVDVQNGVATVELAPGDAATCDYVNTRADGVVDPGDGGELAASGGAVGWRIALAVVLLAMGAGLVVRPHVRGALAD